MIYSLANIDASGLANVGGKARALARLFQTGYPVPAGFVILASAFDDGTLAPAVWHAMQEQLAEWRANQPSIHFAVRSSAFDEDSSAASFAGQFITVLNVAGDDALWHAVHTVYASRQDAAAYRRGHRLAGRQDMAVVLQELIPAECSGVCFSVDPVQPEHRLLVINAGWGMGPGVVEGAVKSDAYWLRRHDLSLERQKIAHKTEQIAPAAEQGIVKMAVPDRQQSVPCLPGAWLRRIGEFALSVEQFFGCPQDVEWAIAGGKLWLLQSRPITGLPAKSIPAAFPLTWETEDDSRSLWTLRRWLPHDVLWTLEHDYIHLLSQGEMEKRRRGGADFLGRALVQNGRIFVGRIPNPEPEAQRHERRAGHEALETRLRAEGNTLWEYYRPGIVAATARLDAFDETTVTGAELAAHLEDALAVFQEHILLHALVWTSLKPFHSAYARLAGIAEAEAESAASELLVGEETALSRFIDGLYDLAVAARAAPAVEALLAEAPADVMSGLSEMPEAADFLVQLQALLQVYGQRCGQGFGSEGTLCMPTLEEQPLLLVSLIGPYLDPAREFPAAVRQRIRAARDAQIEALCEACLDGEIVAEFRRQWAFARKEATVLEDHNYHIDQLAVGQLRRAVRYAGRWLVVRGALSEADDVFWLHFAEILAALRADPPPAFGALIAERQAQHRDWEELEPPAIIGRPPSELPARSEGKTVQGIVSSNYHQAQQPEEKDRLHGLGAGRGQAHGRARILADGASGLSLQPGDVLVAKNAGPLWTPFFPILAGLVLEEGAIGQHAVVTAREYGLPAVIDCPNATQLIPDGAELRVDGTAGIIEIVALRS